MLALVFFFSCQNAQSDTLTSTAHWAPLKSLVYILQIDPWTRDIAYFDFKIYIFSCFGIIRQFDECLHDFPYLCSTPSSYFFNLKTICICSGQVWGWCYREHWHVQRSLEVHSCLIFASRCFLIPFFTFLISFELLNFFR